MKYLKKFNENIDMNEEILELADDCFVEHDFIISSFDDDYSIIIESNDEESVYINFGKEEPSFFYEDIKDDFIKFLEVVSDIRNIRDVDFSYYFSPLQIMSVQELIDGVTPNDKYKPLNAHIDNGALRLIKVNFA